MLLDRRSFTIGSAALVSGCATIPTPPPTLACTPLPPVKVDASRIIRTVAGLRPYRASGFVVRAEALGDKRLVHNYGHGGGGITLSWGSSKLAVDLGLPGHSGPVAVLGSGVMGLSTARLVQDAGFPVTIYAAALPPDTTSNIAGGQFYPFAVIHEDERHAASSWPSSPAALDYSWRRFQIMVGDEYGIRWLPTYDASGRAAKPSFSPTFPPIDRDARPAPNIRSRSPACVRYDTMYVETGRYLRQMTATSKSPAGRSRFGVSPRRPTSRRCPRSLVFNCTGLGSRELFGDTELAARSAASLRFCCRSRRSATPTRGGFGYMFPREDGIVLGGTFERDEWDPNPVPKDIAAIIASHKKFFDGFRCKS